MLTQSTTHLIQWQDLKVRSDTDLFFDFAQKRGWTDYEVFGYGEMITTPQESKGWKLIPADLYAGTIPEEGVDRVLQIINAGIQIKGIVIADDERTAKRSIKPAWLNISLPSAESVGTFIGQVLMGLLMVTAVIAFSPILLPGLLLITVFSFDPKLVILVDDGNGNTVWISILTWYD